MDSTLGAQVHLPSETREPGELKGGRSDRPDPLRLRKTRDVEDETVWVGEGVTVGALDLRPGRGFRDDIATVHANEVKLTLPVAAGALRGGQIRPHTPALVGLSEQEPRLDDGRWHRVEHVPYPVGNTGEETSN